jgi:hypothetical protein
MRRLLNLQYEAKRVIENLELLEELLADQATTSEVVDLLLEPTRGEQLFRVSRAPHALGMDGEGSWHSLSALCPTERLGITIDYIPQLLRQDRGTEPSG